MFSGKTLNCKQVFGKNNLLTSTIIPLMVVVVGGVTLRLVEKADLPPVLNRPAPVLGYADRQQAQGSLGNTGEKDPAPSERLHTLRSWI